jgi:hypothetical protein
VVQPAGQERGQQNETPPRKKQMMQLDEACGLPCEQFFCSRMAVME